METSHIEPEHISKPRRRQASRSTMLSTEQVRQYHAVRQGAALIDRHDRGRILLRGNDRKTFLHALLTNDVAMLAPNTGCYAALLTPQGRMISDLRVFELGDVTVLDVPGETRAAVLAKLDQMLFSEDVQIADMTDALGCASVQGPAAAALLGRVFGVGGAGAPGLADQLMGWAEYHNVRGDLGGDMGILARVDEFGMPGHFVFAPPGRLPAMAAAMAAAGAVVVDPEVCNALRIESGTPQFGADMTGDTIPTEAGIDPRAVSYIKGCFPGQEVLVRIRDRGHGKVARKLVGILVEGSVEPMSGDIIRAAAKDVGAVTSAAWSPGMNAPIALGYVHREHAASGTALEIARGEQLLAARVTDLPFVGPA